MKRRNFLKTTSAAAASAMVIPTVVPSSVFGKSAPSNKIQIGQIGCGRIARGHDLPGTIRWDIARVIAVSDVDSNRMKEGKELVEGFYARKENSDKAIEVKMYDDYKEMLLNPEIDAVIISTPDHWHSQPAIEACLAGKDVYLQKPTSLTITEGRMLSDIARKQGTILQLGTQQRSSDQFRIAAELVRNGRIGKIHTVKVGLPGDPSGPEAGPEPIPENLNYDMWLGSTPVVYYTEKRVHPQEGYNRPGWLRCEQFGAGMITGWGAHHIDTAHWGMGTEYTGPVEVEAEAQFPASGLWNVHGDFKVWAKYENGAVMHISGDYPNGVKFVGEDGWIFVARGAYSVTASDPAAKEESARALAASDSTILESVIGEDEIHFHHAVEQHQDWLTSIKTREEPVAPAEVAHRSCSACLVSHIAMKINRKLYWDPEAEKFTGDDEANAMVSRSQRSPYGTNYIS